MGFPKAGLAGWQGPRTRRRIGPRRPVHARGGHGRGRSPSTTTLSYVLEELGKLKDLGKKGIKGRDLFRKRNCDFLGKKEVLL